MRGIKIDRLEIRLKGIPPEVVRDSVTGLGNELLMKLSKQDSLSRERRAVRINEIDSGTFRTSGDTNFSELRGMIANKIAESIASKIRKSMTEEK